MLRLPVLILRLHTSGNFAATTSSRAQMDRLPECVVSKGRTFFCRCHHRMEDFFSKLCFSVKITPNERLFLHSFVVVWRFFSTPPPFFLYHTHSSKTQHSKWSILGPLKTGSNKQMNLFRKMRKTVF